MTDKSSPEIRYPDLFEKGEAADPALGLLLDDLETIYPPASYPASLPEQLLSTLESHQEPRAVSRAETPLANTPLLPRSSHQVIALPTRRWKRGLSTLAAAVVAMVIVGSLLFVLQASLLAKKNQTGVALKKSPTVFLSISMVDSTHGWAQADDGQGSVLHTSDGGQTWQNATPAHLSTPGYDMSPIFAPTSATSAWLTSGGQTNQGVLFHTTDSGQTWRRVALPAPLSHPFSFTQQFFSLHFMNDQTGWISLLPNNLYWMTTNGGRSWQQLTLPATTSQWNQLTLFDAKNWLLTPATVNTLGQPIVYITHNAGKSWQKKTLPIPAGFSFGSPMENAQTFSARDGKLAVADGGADILIYTTHDSGENWQFSAPLSPDIIQRRYEFGLPSFSSMNDGQFFLAPIPIYGTLPAPIYLIVTHDGGQHWQAITVQLPLVQQPAKVSDRAGSYCQFISPRVGWLAIAYAPSRTGLPRSGLYKTSDGGQTWTSIPYQIENDA